MNGLANWPMLMKALSGIFLAAFLIVLCVVWQDLPLSLQTPGNLLMAYEPISKVVSVALGITGVVFWIFTTWAWRHPIARKLGLVNFPDVSGTWHATSYPSSWKSAQPFATVVSIKHSFHRIRVTLIRNQGIGNAVAASLAAAPTGVRLYVIYESSFTKHRPLSEIQPVEHGERHDGALMTDLVNPDSPPEEWVANGEYWTNKRRSKKDDDSRGTWGHMQLRFKRRTPASAAVEEFCPEDKSWLAEEALRTSEPPAPSPRAIP